MLYNDDPEEMLKVNCLSSMYSDDHEQKKSLLCVFFLLEIFYSELNLIDSAYSTFYSAGTSVVCTDAAHKLKLIEY